MDLTNLSNGQQLILSEDVFNAIRTVTKELAASTGARHVIFAESNGYPVTYIGDVKGLDLPGIASLAAGNFSATAKMASMLGEPGSFKYIYHEGEDRNIYISSVGFNFILVVIFDAEVALGMVRIYTKKAIDGLTNVLKSAKFEEEKSREFLDAEFKALLNEELDRSLPF